MPRKAKTSKTIKEVRLKDISGVKDVSLGHKATADRPDANYAKSAYSQGHEEDSSFADVYARRKRWGLA